MINKITIYVSSLIIFTVFISCSDDPSSIGADLLTPDSIAVTYDTLDQSYSYSQLKYVPLGASNRLLAGRHENVEASFLIRFTFGFPDSVKQGLINDSIVVSSAKIIFTRAYTFGDENGILELGISRVMSSWSSSGFIADSLSNLDTASISVDSLIISDTTTSFKVENSVVQEWLKNAADQTVGSNWGLYVKPKPTSNKIFGYHSLTGSTQYVPSMEIILGKPGIYLDTLYYNPFSDITVLDSIAPYPTEEFITVQSGLKIMSYIRFDITSIPQYAVINKAELILTSDTTKNIIGDINNKILGYVPGDTTNLDSIVSAIADFNKSDNIYTGNITSFVQDWLVSRNNRGIVLTSSNWRNGLERFVFYGSTASPALQPRLVITYTNKL